MNGSYNTPRHTGLFDAILVAAMVLASVCVMVGNVITPAVA